MFSSPGELIICLALSLIGSDFMEGRLYFTLRLNPEAER